MSKLPLDEHAIYPRWADFVAKHGDDILVEHRSEVPWWRRLGMRLTGRRVWEPEQVGAALGLPEGYRVQVNRSGAVRVWLPEEPVESVLNCEVREIHG